MIALRFYSFIFHFDNFYVILILIYFAGFCQPVDKILKQKIRNLMDEGVSKVSEI